MAVRGGHRTIQRIAVHRIPIGSTRATLRRPSVGTWIEWNCRFADPVNCSARLSDPVKRSRKVTVPAGLAVRSHDYCFRTTGLTVLVTRRFEQRGIPSLDIIRGVLNRNL